MLNPRPLPRAATVPIRHDDHDDSVDGDEEPEPVRRPRVARGSHSILAPAEPAVSPPARRSAGETLARVLYFLSGALLAAVVVAYGGQIWRQARHVPEPALPAPAHTAAAVVVAAAGRIELTVDRRTVNRLDGDAPRWTAPQPAALDAIEVTGPVVLGHAPDAITAIDLESGRTRFSWTLLDGERWAAQRPAALGSCLAIVTTRAGRSGGPSGSPSSGPSGSPSSSQTVVRCLDLATGAVRWTAVPAGARDCTQPLEAVPGAYVLPCPGWAAVLDDRTGAVSVEAGGVGLVQDDPPYLLRARSRLALAPWSAARRRFTSTGEVAYGTAAAPASSAVLYKDRLVLRAVESSDDLAVIVPRGAAPVAVTASVYRLADATPLSRSCGGQAAPRYQVLELTPRIGASFDPATVGDRALALLDAATGQLAWTSRKLTGLHAAATGPRICRDGHYFVPVELPGRTGAPSSILWIVDAETGKTAAAVAFDPEIDASVARLTADQIDGDRVVAVGRTGAIEARWQPPGRGLHDARRELEDAIGPLP